MVTAVTAAICSRAFRVAWLSFRASANALMKSRVNDPVDGGSPSSVVTVGGAPGVGSRFFFGMLNARGAGRRWCVRDRTVDRCGKHPAAAHAPQAKRGGPYPLLIVAVS